MVMFMPLKKADCTKYIIHSYKIVSVFNFATHTADDYSKL